MRTQLDRDLEVSTWRVPGGSIWETTSKVSQEDIDAGAPAWWRGDEEASQTSLQAMGVYLSGE